MELLGSMYFMLLKSNKYLASTVKEMAWHISFNDLSKEQITPAKKAEWFQSKRLNLACYFCNHNEKWFSPHCAQIQMDSDLHCDSTSKFNSFWNFLPLVTSLLFVLSRNNTYSSLLLKTSYFICISDIKSPGFLNN